VLVSIFLLIPAFVPAPILHQTIIIRLNFNYLGHIFAYIIIRILKAKILLLHIFLSLLQNEKANN